ncbi:MAG: DUF5011 domain-containing protein [Bacteroidetes bacterium]|nr:DUF5011 domain-containing protein [Bacteroidota bacterium]
MKTLKILFVCLFVSVFAFQSCKKKDETPKDTTAPVISITGSNPFTMSIDSTYHDPGFSAIDETDGDITANISSTNNINKNVVGTYYVKYNVSDAAGNKAVEVSRTILVKIL